MAEDEKELKQLDDNELDDVSGGSDPTPAPSMVHATCPECGSNHIGQNWYISNFDRSEGFWKRTCFNCGNQWAVD